MGYDSSKKNRVKNKRRKIAASKKRKKLEGIASKKKG